VDFRIWNESKKSVLKFQLSGQYKWENNQYTKTPSLVRNYFEIVEPI